MKRLLLFGSTGSIGRNVLDIVGANPNRFRLELLSCRSNVKLVAQQAEAHEVRRVHILDESCADEARRLLPAGVKLYLGSDCWAEMLREIECDLVVNAIVGAAGLQVSYYALARGLDLALANKESLVVGGELLTGLAANNGATILPIDSEHSAIWQCLRAGVPREVEKIILTASGGPFRTWSLERIRHATVEDALNHPNWSMGAKITIDSATMMNKGLEVIEARWLFDVTPGQIEIVIHPESIIHSLVQFVDGAQIAQMSPPDMRLPIAYALAYPERLSTSLPRTDLPGQGSLTFECPDPEKFPAIALAYKALRVGGFAPVVLNAANEIAVAAFLEKKIAFGDIAVVVAQALESAETDGEINLDSLLSSDREVRIQTEELIAAGIGRN
ncbi:MAG: 1-deoxy-D-xylulose-5-phosphate reductoisomerase [bacterium]